MKRKRIFIGAAGFLTVICLIVVGGIPAHADTRDIKSRGNFVLDSGKMSICASDMDYLQSEVQTLYSELPSIFEINASGSGTARRDDLRSKGVINYKNGTAILDSSDLTLIADGIDNLESEYKANTVAALNDINTYFKIDGSVTHDQREENLSTAYANALSLDGLCNGILQSQSVDHLQATPVIADNLTAGTAAWVNGTCIIGNGADNERAYKKGKEDGEDGDGEDMDIEYTYHTHVNGLGEEVTELTVYTLDDPGGCYKADGHEHNKTGKCPSEEKTRPVVHDHEVKGSYGDHFVCEHCGYHTTFGEGDSGAYKTHSCSYNHHYTAYNCGSPTNKWSILCGKDQGDIESVVITIRKRVKE